MKPPRPAAAIKTAGVRQFRASSARKKLMQAMGIPVIRKGRVKTTHGGDSRR